MDYDKTTWRSSGIYAFIHKGSGRAYVGRARIFRDRYWRHVISLNAGKNSNSPLQSDWNIYGADAFEFRILEIVARYPWDLMKEREWAHMCQYESLYNVQMPAPRIRHERRAG